jgi:hypothetical protein
VLEQAEPVIEYLEGWHCDISGVRRWEDLPEAAQRYVEAVEDAVGCPIRYVSVGPERGQHHSAIRLVIRSGIGYCILSEKRRGALMTNRYESPLSSR